MPRPKKKLAMPDIAEFGDDYRPDVSIFRRDDARTHRVKEIIASELTEVDRRIILLYTETGSLRETASLLGCSKTTLESHIKRIRNEIKSRL